MGGSDGPPKPPALGDAPAQPGRPSTALRVSGASERPPPPPTLATAPAEPGRCSTSAVGDLELDSTVERVTRVVGPRAHEVLPEAHARRAGAPGELGRLLIEALLDIGRPPLREAVVVLRGSGPAGMADHVHAHLRRRRP